MKRTGTRTTVILGAALAGSMLLAACGSTSSAKPQSTTTKKGGIAYYAEAAGANPNYILPLTSGAEFSIANLAQFQILMYRPLYFFGQGDKAEINYNLSIGNAPVYSNNDKTVTITLKKYQWSDGQPVTSNDVIFWMNLLKANKVDWGAYVPGDFPDNVVSYSAPNASTVVFHLNQSYSPTWFTYNELSQITPLPLAWDTTSLSTPLPNPSTTSIADMTTARAQAVYKFLNAQAQDLSTYASSPIWSVVDGPWKLASFSSAGHAVFVPNTKYSGPVKPSLSEFVELPFTSDSAEFNVLRAGNNAVTYGYLPNSDASQKSYVESIGYNVEPWTEFGFSYWNMNFNNPTCGPVFKQLYIRQALQHLVDQPAWITSFLHGDAVPNYSPVPVTPSNPFADAASRTDHYPYSTSAAKNLLTSHGWKMVNGVMTCESPGSSATECGAGISKGLALNLNLEYYSGSNSLTEEMTAYASAAKQAGINVILSSANGNTVFADEAPCTPTQPSCKWEMILAGTWEYSPDNYPTGGELFASGAGSNYGNYQSSEANALIAATHTSSDPQAALDAYQNFMAKELPDIYRPLPDAAISLISNKLGGVTQNPYLDITPEDWYFKG
ncbi:ABC transporter substrate-binding protein [Ferrimicrobium sp.]|uniref:ABC transporter substrate-binding protein n=1 Tax=Ferrimicrobium sp. TaxID=2926050 RepID=UPI002638A721|nr:ABC transporter substrate-binding protein [Ferrimicrobium sp.]